MYRFLLTGKWIGWLLIAALGAAACAGLALWQLDRRDQAEAVVHKIDANYDRAPVPAAQAKPYFEAADTVHEWTPVKLTGRYDVADQRVVRNRPLGGQPGYELLVPLHLDTGGTVIIDRGWLPIGNDVGGRPDSIPAPAAGEVTVIARVKPGEPTVPRGAPTGQLASIQLPTYAGQLDYPIFTGGYGLMASESPAAAAMPRPLPKPVMNLGPHLSYSLQWFAFGVLAFVGYGYAARQQALLDEYVEEHEDPLHARRGHTTIRPPRARSRPTAEDEEDALLDAQGYQ